MSKNKSDKKPIRVLQAFGEPLATGGQESFVMNMYSGINHAKFIFDFCTPFECENTRLRKTVEKMGGKIFCGNNKFYSKTRKLSIIKFYKKLHLMKDYDVIHIHSGSIYNLSLIAHYAKKNRSKKIIVHSHSTGYNTISHKISKLLLGKKIYKNADVYIACSKEAGEYKFPKIILDNKNFIIFNNGINLEKYKYDQKKREAIREKFKFNDKHVLCHVGRFSEEKNHLYLLQIFKEYLSIDRSGHLLLIGGSGPEEDKIMTNIIEERLQDKVTVLKNRKDVPDLLNAADIFVFPSKFEGLPISVVEAQTAGLPVICSDTISMQTKVTNNYYSMSINNDPKLWAKTIAKKIKHTRQNEIDTVRNNGFGIEECVAKLEKLYK